MLFTEADYELLKLANIVKRDLPCLGKLRHHWLRFASKQAEDVIKEPPSGSIACDNWFEDVGIADFPQPAHHFLRFEPVDRRWSKLVARSASLLSRGAAAFL